MKDCFGAMPKATRGTRALALFEPFHWRAGAEKISIAVNVIDACDSGPKFVVARPWRRESSLLA
jgi:hypothetical protein